MCDYPYSFSNLQGFNRLFMDVGSRNSLKNRFVRFFDEFIEDCDVRGFNKQTVYTYRSVVWDFLMCYDFRPDLVNPPDLKHLLGAYRSRGLRSRTIKGNFSSVSSFYDFLLFLGVVEVNPVLPFRKRYLKDMLNDTETRQLLSVNDARLLLSSCDHILDKTLVLFGLSTGLRRGELLDLCVDDLDLNNSCFYVAPKRKRRANRTGLICADLKYLLGKYLKWREGVVKEGCPYLWVGKPSKWTPNGTGRIHKDYVNQVLHRQGDLIGVHTSGGRLCDRLTSHCFRHFFTTHLHRAGVNPTYIKFLRGDVMGRESWEIYNHIDLELVRREYETCFPSLLVDDETFINLLPKPELSYLVA